MIHPLKITGTMADETRYHIYEHMLKHKRPFRVQEIAEAFHIHPNVARHHLAKLTEINVISADFLKTGKGGRPGRVYKINEDGVQISFPKRDDSLLLNLLIEAIAKSDINCLELAKKIAFEHGQKSIRHVAPSIDFLNYTERIQLLEKQVALIGYVVQVTDPKTPTFHFHVYNCPFQTHIKSYAQIICSLHEGYIKGQMSVLFPNNNCIQINSMLNGCASCLYKVK